MINKNINEMAKLQFEECKKCGSSCEFDHVECDIITKTCNTLYKAGYRKVYGTVEQFDDIVESQKIEIERLKNALTYGKCINCKIFDEMAQKLKQRAIKEFAERLKFYFTPCVVKNISANCEINANLLIDDLLKEYGIGEEQ